MNLISQVLSFIFIASHISRAIGDILFLCTFDKHLIYTELECPKERNIHLLSVNTIQLKNNSSHCGNISTTYNEMLLEQKYGVSGEKSQKILNDCSAQQSCRVGLYSDYYTHPYTFGILIEYDCVEAVKFIPFCQGNLSKRYFERDVYLVHRVRSTNQHGTCVCDVEYTGYASVTLTHIPNQREYLQITTTWKDGGRTENTSYNDHVYTNVTVAYNSEKTKFSIITKEANTEDNHALVLVRIAAKGAKSKLSLQCTAAITIGDIQQKSPRHIDEGYCQTQSTLTQTEPMQVDISNSLYTVICVVTLLCIIGINICAFILCRRRMINRYTHNASCSENKRSTPSESTNPETRSRHASVYVDCSGRLTSSYEEPGSISDYRRYACPDATSNKTSRVTVHYETLNEEHSDSEENAIHTQDTTLNVTSQQRLSITMNDEMGKDTSNTPRKNRYLARKCNEETEKVNESTNEVSVAIKVGEHVSSDDSNKITSATKDSAERPASSDSIKIDGNYCTAGARMMLPLEHYDPSGYLCLDVPEKTTNANLMQWKEDIYSIEHSAREMRKNPLNWNMDKDVVDQSTLFPNRVDVLNIRIIMQIRTF